MIYAEVTGSTTYLGRRLEVRRDKVIFGVGPKHVQKILKQIGLKDLNDTSELKRDKITDEEDVEMAAMGQAEYRSMVGHLSGLTVRTPGVRSASLRRSLPCHRT